VESFDARSLIAALRARREAEAASLGLTVEQLDAHEAEGARLAKEAEYARKLRDCRQAVVTAYGSRMLAETAEAFVDGMFTETQAVAATREWSKGDKAFLILHGGTGAGKTMAAMIAMIGVRAIMVRSPDLGRVIEPWSSDGRNAPLDPSWHRLFVLDDLGAERADDARWATSFDELIDARQGLSHGKRLRTIITTNLTPQQIRAKYSERALSRVGASNVSVILSDADMRKKRAT
jgi:DNA replication protein DnaC